MPKSSKSKHSGFCGISTPAAPPKYKDRPLANMTPDKAQEAVKPSEAVPISLHHRMAGGG